MTTLIERRDGEATEPSRFTPLGRLEALCDPGSLQLVRSGVRSRRIGDRARPGDGVLGGTGRIAGRPVAVYAQDQAYLGGSLGEVHADTIVSVLRMAGRARIPVVGFVESGGARLQEGVAALGGYGRIFAEQVRLHGVVPQISVITGLAAGGGSYSPALTDFVVMTERAALFLTGPGVVRETMGEDVSVAALGGHGVHDRNGVCAFTVPGDDEAVVLARRLLALLGDRTPPAIAPPDLGDPGDVVPEQARRVYDVRDVARRIVDGGELVEASPRWARNMVTALARIDGRTVGIVANQPRHLGGVIDATGAQKAARFIGMCDGFGVPLVVLVDTPGFLPGTRQEGAGVIRHGASLLAAFAGARVPKLTVVLRKAFGGAYITMNSKDLGADLVFAWPSAQLGVMGGEQAAGVLFRRDLAAAPSAAAAAERRRELGADYADEHLGVAAAAAEGAIDEVIEPHETRARLAAALATLDPRS